MPLTCSIFKRHRSPLRNAIKWGGLAVTMSIVSLWVLSGFVCVSINRGGGRLGIEQSRIFRYCGFPPSSAASGIPLIPAWMFAERTHWLFVSRARVGAIEFEVSLWLIVPPLALITAAMWRLDFLAHRRSPADLCPQCGYSRAGLSGSDSPCPECGHAQSAPTA